MSDVSGIPYMGPMGMGNFFAPPFSSNPQMSAGQISSTYMPEIYNNQNVVNNLFNTPGGGGGFGRATDYYSALGANYLAQVPSSWQNPYTHGAVVPQSLRVPGGDYSNVGMSYYGGNVGGPGATINNDMWRTSPQGPDFMGGGGFYSGGLGGLSSPQQSYGGPGIDWGGVGRAAGGGGGYGADMFGGLAGGAGAYQGPNNQIDWSTLFSGGGGGAQQPTVDPYPNMAMPGGLNSPMTMQQQAPIDFGSLMGQGMGGTAGGQPSGASVFDTGTAPITGTQDTGPYGGGLGIGGLDTGRAIGEPYTAPSEPNQTPMVGPQAAEAYNPYYGVTSPYDQRTSGEVVGPGGGLSATDLSAQAREQLAKLMSTPKEPSVDDIFGGDKPIPTEGQPAVPPTEAAPASTDPFTEAFPDAYAAEMAKLNAMPTAVPAADSQPPPRPPENIPLSGATLKGVNSRLVAAVQGGAMYLPPGYQIKLVSGKEPREFGYHPRGTAIDIKIIGPDGKAIPHKGEDTTGMYTLLARGVKAWTQQNDPVTGGQIGYGGAFGTRGGKPGEVPDLMHYDLGGSRGQMRPEVQFGRLQPVTTFEMLGIEPAGRSPQDVPNARTSGASSSVPLPAERPAEAPALESRVNLGQDVSPPPMNIPEPQIVGPGFNALDAAAPPSGVERAQTFLNRSLESILREHSPENLSRAGWVLDLKQPMREALKGPFGGQILSGLEPKLGNVGLTRADFAKAVADPRARFGGEFGGMGGEMPSPGAFTPYEGFRQSPDVEDRTADPGMGRRALAIALGMDKGLEAGAPYTLGQAEQGTPDTPLARALGVDAIEPLLPRAGGGDNTASPAAPSKGTPYWDIPKAGTPRYNAEVYEPAFGGFIMRRPEPETTGGSEHYADFPRTGDVEDRRNEILGRDELAALKAAGTSYSLGPEDPSAMSNPLSQALGLGALPTSMGAASNRMVRPQGFTGDFDDVFSQFSQPSERYSDALYGRDTNPVDAAIRESAPAAGLDFPYWKAIADIESGLNPALNQDKKTQYKGLYQLGSRATNPEWAEQGMGDIYNPMDNALAAARIFQNNREWFTARYGRDPTPGEAYLMHNQGRGFFTNNTLTNAANNAPAGYGFRLPPTRDTFLEDWSRRIEQGAAKYR